MPGRRFGTFTGGIDLPDDKHATLGAPIVPAGHVRRLAVPLAMADAPPAEPTVWEGQYVSQGERIARADDDRQVDVFAPLAGRVGGRAEVVLPGGDGGWRVSSALVLTDLDHPTGLQPLPARYEWQAADAHSIRLRIAEGSLPTCETVPRPLAGWIDSARRAGVQLLIANVMENTPYVTADHRLLAEWGTEVVRGLAILARALETEAVILAVDRRRTDAYRSAVGPAELYGIDAIALAHKYPVGAEAILVKVLTRREVPLGGGPFDVGVAVTDAASCWAVYRWVACGEPPGRRVVTVAGDALRHAGNFLVPFGADADELLEAGQPEEDAARVYGPAMTGPALAPGAVVGPGVNALLALHVPETAPPTACIRCGWCVQNCPARLNVSALNDDFELGRVRRARRRGALACVGCGSCSYVCPARLPLARRVGLLKRAIGADREATAHVAGDAPQR